MDTAKSDIATQLNGKKLYKVLAHDGQSQNGGSMVWSLPTDEAPGSWHEVSGDVRLCEWGLHLTLAPIKWMDKGVVDGAKRSRVFEVEAEGFQKDGLGNIAFHSGDDKCVAKRARLLREVTGADLEALGVYVFKDGHHELKDLALVDGRQPLVYAYDKASVYAYDKASVTASGTASVTAYGTASVKAYDKASVKAYDKASVTAYDKASVTAYGKASVYAYDKASVTASGTASVYASGTASVTAYGTASVTASGTASVYAYDKASVTAYDKASVKAFKHAVTIIPYDGYGYGYNDGVRVELNDDASAVDYRSNKPKFHTRKSWGPKAAQTKAVA